AFLDSMESDVERLKRINNTLRHIPRAVREHSELELRPIELLEISPSQSLDIVAEEHAHELPRALKMALGNPGKGSGVTSYLLFSEGYCRALIQLGYDDAMAQASSVREFFRDHFDDSQLS
ncbi:MAG: patatin-like phospholipase family protein, partial [Oceanobacter sp.]